MSSLRYRVSGPERSLGLSLVELMVAIVIGMLSMLVVFQVFTTFEEQKRVSTGGSESLEHGAIALNMLASRIGQAGFGMMVPNTLDCLVRGSSEPIDPAGTDSNYTFRLQPVFITQGANGAPDQVSVIFGNSPMILGGVDLIEPQNGTEADFQVTDTYGFAPRHRFIVSQPNSTPRKDCTLREATQVSNVSPFVIKHASRFRYTDNRQPEKSQNNKSGGSGIDYLRGAKVYNFGNLSTSIFAVREGHLLMGSPLVAPADWALMLDNVVSIQALYGFDTRAENTRNGTLVVDTYSETLIDADGDGTRIGFPQEGDTDPDDWLRLGALRIGLVVRTSQAEMPASRDVTQCTATTNSTLSFSWPYRDAGGTNRVLQSVDVSKEYDIAGNQTERADWRCYRYKAFDTIVALRNIKWSLPK